MRATLTALALTLALVAACSGDGGEPGRCDGGRRGAGRSQPHPRAQQRGRRLHDRPRRRGARRPHLGRRGRPPASPARLVAHRRAHRLGHHRRPRRHAAGHGGDEPAGRRRPHVRAHGRAADLSVLGSDRLARRIPRAHDGGPRARCRRGRGRRTRGDAPRVRRAVLLLVAAGRRRAAQPHRR